jgi:hypothetical protein
MSANQYDECIRRLEAAGAGKPPGHLYHACYGNGDQMRVFDVWESQEAFERFGSVLMPILQQLGLNPGAPEVVRIHNFIWWVARAQTICFGLAAMVAMEILQCLSKHERLLRPPAHVSSSWSLPLCFSPSAALSSPRGFSLPSPRRACLLFPRLLAARVLESCPGGS